MQILQYSALKHPISVFNIVSLHNSISLIVAENIQYGACTTFDPITWTTWIASVNT